MALQPYGFQPYKPKAATTWGKLPTAHPATTLPSPQASTAFPQVPNKGVFNTQQPPIPLGFSGVPGAGPWDAASNFPTAAVPVGRDKFNGAGAPVAGPLIPSTPGIPMTAGGGLIGPGNPMQTGTSFDPYASQRAAAAGAAAGANASSAAAGRIGQQQEQSQAGAMNAASSAAASLASQPKPGDMGLGMGSYQPMGFSMPQLTMENLQPYMTPYLDQIIARGNENILANASARGHLRSTGLEQQLGGWAADATAQAFQDAQSAFFRDRGDLFGAYQYADTTGYNRFADDRDFGYGVYRDQVDDYNQGMAGQESRMAQLAALAPQFMKMGIDLTTDQGQAIANLYLALAAMQGQAGVAKAGAQGDFLGGILEFASKFIGNSKE